MGVVTSERLGSGDETNVSPTFGSEAVTIDDIDYVVSLVWAERCGPFKSFSLEAT